MASHSLAMLRDEHFSGQKPDDQKSESHRALHISNRHDVTISFREHFDPVDARAGPVSFLVWGP